MPSVIASGSKRKEGPTSGSVEIMAFSASS